MSHLDILLPFGLPPSEMAADLLRELHTPALATLISRSKLLGHREWDPFSRSLPHEYWLANQFGIGDQLQTRGSPPVTGAAMQSFGLPANDGVWFMLQPVHLHVARDHLVLTNWQQLPLSEAEAHQLFDAIKPLFDEQNMQLLYGDARHWFMRCDEWDGLQTATPDAACGHNIDVWLPKGAGERAWRKLQNEIQMTWHSHPVNAEREARGAKPVNSLWLWGGTFAHAPAALSEQKQVFSLPGAEHAFARYHSMHLTDNSFQSIASTGFQKAIAVVDSLTESALSSDWAEWLNRYHSLENDWFFPLLEALKAGKISRITLILTHSTDLSEFSTSRQSLRKFWVRPTLSKLRR